MPNQMLFLFAFATKYTIVRSEITIITTKKNLYSGHMEHKDQISEKIHVGATCFTCKFSRHLHVLENTPFPYSKSKECFTVLTVEIPELTAKKLCF